MDAPVLRLFPPPQAELPLRGLYLEEGLRGAGGTAPFVFTNFIASLDGRIAQPDPVTRRKRVPPSIANPRDWRLYLELAAQADVLLTSARHLRAVAAERHQDLLALDEDLVQWRIAQGLSPAPKVAAVGEQLDIPLARLVRYTERLLVVTSGSADPDRVAACLEAGIPVLRAGPGPGLSGKPIVEALVSRGLRRIYSIAGPRVHHALLADDVLDRIYLTVAHRLLGGEEADTLTRGPWLDPALSLRLRSLHLDAGDPEQLFACYERSRSVRTGP